MDLLPIIPTSNRRDIRVLHLETTDVCQAACPLCLRETDSLFDRAIQNHLTINQLQQTLVQVDISLLTKAFACGNYGDPAAGKYTQDIFSWLRDKNLSIVLGMNTNGGLQDRVWWRNLARLFKNPYDYVVFSIDGLEDTNHVYRINVRWDRIMTNAQEFIDAGGSAHWDMLIYQHNQHQIDDAINLARQMGFKWFRAKVSKRPLANNLKYPIGWQLPSIHVDEIQCHALKEHSIYVNAQGMIIPCCWLANSSSVAEIDFESIQRSWRTEKPEPVCKSTCGTSINQSRFEQQWRLEIQL